MNNKSNLQKIVSWLFGIIIFTIGVLNLFLVHAIPGIIYLLLSLVYLPPANALLKKKIGIIIPSAFKIILGIAIIWFTLGVGDLMEIFESRFL